MNASPAAKRRPMTCTPVLAAMMAIGSAPSASMRSASVTASVCVRLKIDPRQLMRHTSPSIRKRLSRTLARKLPTCQTGFRWRDTIEPARRCRAPSWRACEQAQVHRSVIVFEPPYAQVARAMRERIGRTGSTEPATACPQRRSCARSYAVSRMTVRRAVTLLARDDVVVTEHGRGTFVKAPELGTATFDLDGLHRAWSATPRHRRCTSPRRGSCRLARACVAKLAVDAEVAGDQHQAAARNAGEAGLLPQRVSRVRSAGVRWWKPNRGDRAARPPG